MIILYLISAMIFVNIAFYVIFSITPKKYESYVEQVLFFAFMIVAFGGFIYGLFFAPDDVHSINETFKMAPRR